MEFPVAAAPQDKPSSGLTVLLVEDSPILAQRLAELVTDTPGMRLVATVDTELAAIEALGQQGVDVVLLDLHLRQGTGFGVLRSLPDSVAKDAIVIVLTNYNLDEYRRIATGLGAGHYLDKLRDLDSLPDLLQFIGRTLQ